MSLDASNVTKVRDFLESIKLAVSIVKIHFDKACISVEYS